MKNTNVYAGGIPGDSEPRYPLSSSEGQDLVQPSAGPSEVKMGRESLGSIDTMGKNKTSDFLDSNSYNPKSMEENIASRKEVSNQPK